MITSGSVISIAINFTLYNKLRVCDYTEKFVFGNGMEAKERKFRYNEINTYLGASEKEGYKFFGWKPSPSIASCLPQMTLLKSGGLKTSALLRLFLRPQT